MQNEARRKIQELVTKYEQVKTSGKLNKYSEQDTKDSFIRPMFEALGWDFDNRDEVSKEEFVNSAGRVDYGIYLNNQPKLFIEAKKLGADIHKPEFAEQAIRYCFNRVVTWAVLTDFETLKVFNAQNTTGSLSDKLYFEIPYTQYLDRFDQIWQLSRESLEVGLIDQEAMRVGKLQQKITVTEQLAKDLNLIRDMLTQKLHQWNEQVSPSDLDEGVQKLLDRLIFLRVAEDRGIEEPILKQLIRDYANKRSSGQHLYQSMIEKFRELDAIYNSGLFSPHPFENWQEYSGVTEQAINTLYGKSGYYEYDFKFIPSDVLGQVYENYLGHLLNKSRKGLTLDTSAKKRKEQGIYYTPSYIEDYIVEQALKPVLKKCNTIADIKAIKVLDPACGSGSFLIKVIEMIAKKYDELGGRTLDKSMLKITILLDNIYGVDLDEKAVEIARLNLTINSLESRMKLPGLESRIKNGNSLISGTDEELKKHFGKNYRDKKPFNWQEEFPEVFNRPNPGFDVIIGNPPYVGSLELTSSGLNSDKEFYKQKYSSAIGNFDLYVIFIQKAISLLRDEGNLSYITPNKFLVSDYGKCIRNLILKYKILLLTDFSHINVFDQAAVYPVVFVVNKVPISQSHNTVIGKSDEYFHITTQQNHQVLWIDNKNKAITFESKEDSTIIAKIEGNSTTIEQISKVQSGTTGFDYQRYGNLITDSLQQGFIKFVITRNIYKYAVSWGNINYLKSSFSTPYFDVGNDLVTTGRKKLYLNNNKILVRGMSKKVVAGLDIEGKALGVGVYAITDYSLNKYILLGFLNSSLVNYYYKTKFKDKHLAGGYLGFNAGQIKQIPIYDFEKNPHPEVKKLLTILGNKAFTLQSEIISQQENSTTWKELKKEIDRIDRQIDQLVYQLYDLTEEEISIIEKQSN